MANDDLDLSDLSDEEGPTYQMTWEDWVRFCNGDELRARDFMKFQSDIIEEPSPASESPAA